MKNQFHFDHTKRRAWLAAALAALGTASLVSCAEAPMLPPADATTEPPVQTAVTTVSEETTSHERTEQSSEAFESTTEAETEVSTETEPPAPVLRTETEEEREAIPYEVVYEYSNRYYSDVRFTKQEGKDGELLRVTVTTFENETVAEESVTETVLSEPVQGIVIIGTKETVTYGTETEQRDIVSCGTTIRYDDTKYDDERSVLERGADGYTLITYRVTYYKGMETFREEISAEYVSPRNEVVSVGTKAAWTSETVTEKGNVVSYQTTYIYDDTVAEGERFTRTEGRDGYTTTVYTLNYYRGEFSSKVKGESTVTAPIDEVIVIGTKKEEGYGLPFKTGQGYYLSQGYHSGHTALDFAVWYGDPILAVKSGTVVMAYDEGDFSKDNLNWTYGTFVVIEHEGGVRSLYAHLKSRSVSVGDRVSGGEIIGTSGNTGRVNPMPGAGHPLAGTHLHFEIRVKQNGSYKMVDPRDYIPDF